MPVWWRRVRQHFGISAPRMAVRTHLPWWGRGAILAALLAIIGGMWWWGFDFGQIFGGFNRKEVEARLATLETDAARFRAEAIELRARNSALEIRARDDRGAQDALSRQATELSGENAQLKEELAFLQKLVSDSSKTVGPADPARRRRARRRGHVALQPAHRARRQPEGRVRRQRRAAGERCGRRGEAPPPGSSSFPRTTPTRRPGADASNSSIISGLRVRFRVPPGAPGHRRGRPRLRGGPEAAARDADLEPGIGDTMFERKKHAPPQKRIDCLIGAGTTVRGRRRRSRAACASTAWSAATSPPPTARPARWS